MIRAPTARFMRIRAVRGWCPLDEGGVPDAGPMTLPMSSVRRLDCTPRGRRASAAMLSWLRQAVRSSARLASTSCGGSSCGGCSKPNARPSSGPLNPTEVFKPAHATPAGRPLVGGVLHGDVCSSCGMIGHSAHACTVIRTEAGQTRLCTTLDWEVRADPPNPRMPPQPCHAPSSALTHSSLAALPARSVGASRRTISPTTTTSRSSRSTFCSTRVGPRS